MSYSDYPAFSFERPADGVLLIKFNQPEKYNALDKRGHEDLARVWREVDADDETRVVVITGEGRAFCAGGSIQTDLEYFGDVQHLTEVLRAARDLVYNIINCRKPIISAINGPAAGAA